MRKEIRVYYAGKRLRGFHRYLLDNPPHSITYEADRNDAVFFEVKPWYLQMAANLWNSKLGDVLGLIEAIRVPENDYAIIQTFNRFSLTNRPYIIYLENPTALFHYELGRRKSFLGKRKLRLYLNDINLKAVVCMSGACLNTLESVLPVEIPERITQTQIYPLVPLNSFVNKKEIEKRVKAHVLRCLYISSDFVIKGGKEIFQALAAINQKFKIELTIITQKASIPEKYLTQIRESNWVRLLEFNLPFSSLEKIYSESHILLHPTLKDSFGLVILEAVKAGLPVISTDLYAIPELVKDNKNGFLIEPPVRYFNADRTPNESLWKKDRLLVKNTPYQKLVDFIIERLNILNDDRDRLLNMSLASWNLATQGKLSTGYIQNKWLEIYRYVKTQTQEGNY